MDQSMQTYDDDADARTTSSRLVPTLRRALDGLLIAVAVAGIVGTTVLYQELKSVRNSLQATIDRQAKDLSASHTRLDEAQRASKDLQGQLSALNGRCNASDAQFKSTVDAFAKQAGACEALRQKLHIVGYSS